MKKLPLLIVALALVSCGRAVDGPIEASGIKRYAFFTWARSGYLCFALMPEPESEKFIHKWFPRRDGRCGVVELKKSLASLPAGSYVYWKTWPPKGFRYPPDKMINEIRQFAESHGLHFYLNPALS